MFWIMTSSTICVNHKLKVLECHISARGQLRSLMTQGDQRCERIVRPGGELIPAWGHRWSLWPEVWKDQLDRSEIKPLLWSSDGHGYVKWHEVWMCHRSVRWGINLCLQVGCDRWWKWNLIGIRLSLKKIKIVEQKNVDKTNVNKKNNWQNKTILT